MAARHVLGRLLEPIGNDGSRKMITQRHNPAYRFACSLNEYKNGAVALIISAQLLSRVKKHSRTSKSSAVGVKYKHAKTYIFT